MRTLLFRVAWLAVGALAALAALECVLRLLPVSNGFVRTAQIERWPLLAYEPRQPYTFSTTWQMRNVHRGTTNNYGHIAPFEYRTASRPVIVIGDSYIEALMNSYKDTLQGQLGERLGAPESVYGLGFSGLSAGDYLAVARLAGKEFAPRAVVIVIFNGDFAESLLARQDYYHFMPYGDSFRLVYVLADSQKPMKATLRKTIGGLALYRYVFGHLGFSFATVFKPAKPEAQGEPRGARVDIELQRQVIDFFLAQLPRAAGVSPRCIAFLVDSDRYAIYNPKLASAPKEKPEVRRYFLDRAEQLGFAVSDLDTVFRARYARDGAKFDDWPNDRHWNRAGHGVAADEAYRLLSGERRCLSDQH